MGIGMVKTSTIEVNTRGNCHVVNITEEIGEALAKSGLAEGMVTVFNVGSTAGITTTEFEPGLVKYDIIALTNVLKEGIVRNRFAAEPRFEVMYRAL